MKHADPKKAADRWKWKYKINPVSKSAKQKCGRCKRILPLDAFNKNQSWCKECEKKYKAERRKKK